MPSTYYTIPLRFDIFLKPPPPPSLLNADQIMVIAILYVNICIKWKLTPRYLEFPNNQSPGPLGSADSPFLLSFQILTSSSLEYLFSCAAALSVLWSCGLSWRREWVGAGWCRRGGKRLDCLESCTFILLFWLVCSRGVGVIAAI